MKKIDQRLKAIRTTQSVEELITALDDRSHLVVEAAAKRIDQPRGVAPLVRTYLRLHQLGAKGDPGCWARIAIIESLGRMGAVEGEEAAFLAVKTVQVEPVAGGMADTATGLRVAGASFLANLGSPGALIDLGILLFDREPNAPCSVAEAPFSKLATRVAAARAIGALGDPGGAALLALKLAQPDGELTEVLGESMDGLVALAEPRTVELLQPWLTRGDEYLAAVAATAIAKAGREKAVPVLLEAVRRVEPKVREVLVLAIGSIRADEARAALEELAQDEDEFIRRPAEGLL